MGSLFGTVEPGDYSWGGTIEDELIEENEISYVSIDRAGRNFVILTIDSFPQDISSIQVEQRKLKNKRPASLWKIVKRGIKEAGDVKIYNLDAGSEYQFRFKFVL